MAGEPLLRGRELQRQRRGSGVSRRRLDLRGSGAPRHRLPEEPHGARRAAGDPAHDVRPRRRSRPLRRHPARALSRGPRRRASGLRQEDARLRLRRGGPSRPRVAHVLARAHRARRLVRVADRARPLPRRRGGGLRGRHRLGGPRRPEGREARAREARGRSRFRPRRPRPSRGRSTDVRRVLVGTAGHIDHGKSALVRALTGTDPDRLPEEKARGITIDLGFAHAAWDDTMFSFVDVPGHEKFVRTMVAGRAGSGSRPLRRRVGRLRHAADPRASRHPEAPRRHGGSRSRARRATSRTRTPALSWRTRSALSSGARSSRTPPSWRSPPSRAPGSTR